MRHKRPDPLLLIILFVGLGLIVTTVAKEFPLPDVANTVPAQLLADDESRKAR